MELRTIRIDADKLPDSWMLPGNPELRLLPLGDIQLGDDTDAERLNRYIKWAVRIDGRVIGMGDYTDFESPSGRVRSAIKKAQAYDTEDRVMDKAGRYETEEAYERLKPLQGRFYGLIRGHHWCQFGGDQGDSVSMLAKMLETENVGDCAMFELDFRRGSKSLKAHVWAHHGTGSGMVSTSALTRLEHITKTFSANVYLMGHQSKKGVSAIPWIRQEGGRTVGTNRYIVATGSFMEGYRVGSADPWGNPRGTYVEQKMLTPVALGAPLVMVRPMFDEGRIDINVCV